MISLRVENLWSGAMEQLNQLVAMLIRAGFSGPAALLIALCVGTIGAGLYVRKWVAKFADQPLELKIKAGRSHLKFVRKPSPPRSG
jgi:hypothetical protein